MRARRREYNAYFFELLFIESRDESREGETFGFNGRRWNRRARMARVYRMIIAKWSRSRPQELKGNGGDRRAIVG